MTELATAADIGVLILSGGASLRMHGQDKGLALFKSKPLVEHVLERVQAQVPTVRISANRNLEQYTAFGVPVITDATPGPQGPLVGIYRGLETNVHTWMATVPCDTPFIRLDYIEHLCRAQQSSQSLSVVARHAQQIEPLFLLLHHSGLAALKRFDPYREQSVRAWLATLSVAYADFPDDDFTFLNLNTPEQLRAAEQLP